jgi:predicted nuclease of restriction endonuclease-like (RecB) superfamily
VDELLGPETDGYQTLLRELKERIRTARLQAALAVNQELVLLYWGIGREILERQAREGWGSRVIDRLSADLRRDFPDMTGLSARNLKYMRTLAETHPDREFVQQVVARLPWGHVIRLMENVKDSTRREWYARQAIEHGWSRNVLVHQIETNLYERQGKALTNFSRTLPAVQSELAQQLIKDPTRLEPLLYCQVIAPSYCLMSGTPRQEGLSEIANTAYGASGRWISKHVSFHDPTLIRLVESKARGIHLGQSKGIALQDMRS